MAIQVLDTRKPLSPGQQISKGLVSGLGGYLDRLAQSKLQEIERQRTAQGLQSLGYEPEEARGLSQLPQDIQKEVIREQYSGQREARRAGQKTIQDIVSGEKASRSNIASLNKMEELDRKGKVQGLSGEILKKVGLGRFRSADTQEFEKLSVGMLNNLKNVFGARPTNLDVKLFMESIPTLSQSPEGRAQIINNLKILNEAGKIRGQALRDILKENKGRTPANLDLEIENRVGDQLEMLNQQLLGTEGSSSQDRFEQLPNPAQYQGKMIRDTQSGQLLMSNGSQWIPQG